MAEFEHAVYIGRFQPFHSGHAEVIKYGLTIADQVIVVAGSASSAPSLRNPFSFEDRKNLILQTFPPGYSGDPYAKVKVVGVRDYHYNENAWLAEVQSTVAAFIKDGDPVALIGNYSDESSYYLNLFPQWALNTVTSAAGSFQSGTEIREHLFSVDPKKTWEEKIASPADVSALKVPQATYNFLQRYTNSLDYAKWVQEYQYLKKYKEQWAGVPFPPIFVTVDAVVQCSGHILLVRRGHHPGKGQLALPGGFLGKGERLRNAAVRELREETRIKLPVPLLDTLIKSERVFDYPGRSLRGRTISHGFFIPLPDGPLPHVGGGSDASEAFWMPLATIRKSEDQFFEDHFHIIDYFTSGR